MLSIRCLEVIWPYSQTSAKVFLGGLWIPILTLYRRFGDHKKADTWAETKNSNYICILFILCGLLIFTARAYARAVLGVVILSVCLSVTRVHCDKTKWHAADIFIPHERAITLLLWYQRWLVGDVPFPLKSALKVTHHPSRNGDFDRFPLITSQP